MEHLSRTVTGFPADVVVLPRDEIVEIDLPGIALLTIIGDGEVRVTSEGVQRPFGHLNKRNAS